MRLHFKYSLILFLFFFVSTKTKGQCHQDYNWATWQNFSGTTAQGIINNNGKIVDVSITANYNFNSTPDIYGFPAFNNFNNNLPSPNSTVPRITWTVLGGGGGVTNMCFNQTVENPVLLLSSLGSMWDTVTIHFSTPYKTLFDGGGMTYVNDSTITGQEGYAILLFPGKFNCVTIYSTTPEDYTNLTWGLNPPSFPVSILGNPDGCKSVTLTATGGVKYSWNGGIYPDSALNTFDSSGTYILTVIDSNGCTVTTSKRVNIKRQKSTINDTICAGQSFLNHSTSGTYIDTLVSVNGCDSIRTLHLTVRDKSASTIDDTICPGQSFLGYSTSGTYIDTLLTANGCDSIRTLHLTVAGNSDSTINLTICEGEEFLGHTESGFYTDILPGTNNCVDIIRTTLTVLRNCYVYFPTAFTPNSDHKNDVFKILNAHDLEDYNLSVYNRWGQKVFETNKYDIGWDGSYNGELQQTGVFVWYCTFKFQGKFNTKKGTVVLIR